MVRSYSRPATALLLILLATAQADAEEPWNPKPNRQVANLVTPAADKAIESGLRFLARGQQASGAFGSHQYPENIAVTSLAALALLSGGSVPGEGPYGENVDRAIDFVLKNTSPSGFIVVEHSTSHGPMYDHGFGTVLLAEAYGMTRRTDIREKLKKATQLIIHTQNDAGGWRYQPQKSVDADLSVTVCQMMALRAARNAGIAVPRGAVDRCVDYIRKSQNPDGGYRYMLAAGPSLFPRSAGAVAALYNAGIYEGKDLDNGLDYMMKSLPAREARRASHYFYGQYYGALAMYQAGEPYWEKWYPAIRDELVSRARPDGSWSDSICSEYGTAMACIILQMPNNFLPIFQR